MIRIKLIQLLIDINEKLIFYPRLKRFYKSNVTNHNPLIIDVGVNKGQTIDFFLSIFPNATIYGFEPNKRLFQKLSVKYQRLQNVKLFNKGISNTVGSILFHESILDETSTFEELNYDSEYLKYKAKVLGVKPREVIQNTYEVEVITLADFFTAEGIKKVDVLKIDTEGHEYKCLLGLFNAPSLPDISFIQLEQHKDDMYKNIIPEEEISKLLSSNNYHIFSRTKHGFGDFDEVIYKKDNSIAN